MLALVSAPVAVGQNFSGSELTLRDTPAWTTPLSPTTSNTNGDRAAVCADAFRGMKVSSNGRPSINPPAPRRTIRRFMWNGFESVFFMARLSGKAIEERVVGDDGELEVVQRDHSGAGQPRVVINDRLLVGRELSTVQVAHHVLRVAGVCLLGGRQPLRELDAVREGLPLAVERVAVRGVHRLADVHRPVLAYRVVILER